MGMSGALEQSGVKGIACVCSLASSSKRQETKRLTLDATPDSQIGGGDLVADEKAPQRQPALELIGSGRNLAEIFGIGKLGDCQAEILMHLIRIGRAGPFETGIGSETGERFQHADRVFDRLSDYYLQ
jgi:hypothetical protein